MAAQRYDYLDIAKGFGILAVVWAHILLVGWSHQLCYAFHMPLFFLISGMLFQKDKYPSFWGFIKKRTRRLFVPYILYSIATWAMWVVFRVYRGDVVESYCMPLLQTLIAQGSGAYIVHNSALWFIPCLFAVEIMYFFVAKLKDWVAIAISFAIAALSFLFGNIYGDNWWFLLPWNFDAAMIALSFYCVGHILVKNISHEKMVNKVKANKWGVLVTWAVSFLLLVRLTMDYGVCSMGSSSYGCEGWIFMIRAFVGCSSMLLFSLLLSVSWKNGKAYQKMMDGIKWLGKNSLDVMCTHIPIKGVFVIMVAALWKVSLDTVSSTISLASVVFVATILVVVIITMLVNYIFRNKTRVNFRKKRNEYPHF